MAHPAVAIGTVAIWLASVVVAAWLARRKRKETFEDYTLAARSLPHWLVSFSLLGTWIGGGMMIALAGQISRKGIVYAFMPFGVALSFVLLGVLAPVYRSIAKTSQQEYIESDAPTSLVDRFARQYGSGVRTTMAILVCIIMFSFMAVQLRAGALVFARVAGTDALLSTILLAIVIALYVWVGGARADAYTDVAQVIIVIVAVLGGLLALVCTGGFGSAWREVNSNAPDLMQLPPEAAVLVPGLLILPILAMHTDSGLQQKLLTAAGDRHARIGSYIAAAIFAVFGIALVLLSILSSTYSHAAADADGVLIAFASNALHPAFSALFYAAILAAVSSSLDSQAILVSTVFVNDVLFRLKSSPLLTRAAETGLPRDHNVKRSAFSLSRLWAAICIFLGFLLTLVPLRLFPFLGVIWVCALAAFSVPALALKWPWLRRGLRTGVVTAMLLWSAVGTVGIAAYCAACGVDDLMPTLVKVGFGFFFLNFLIAAILAFATKAPSEEPVEIGG